MMQFLNNLNGTRLGTILQTILYISGVPLFQDNITSDGFTRSGATVFRNLEVEGPHPDDPLNTRCYGALGCITVKYPEQRGFHLFPEPLHDIRPDVCLFTFAAKDKCQQVEPDDLDRLITGPGRNSYWLTHGYIENSHRPWIQRMASELLDNDNESSVFILDWGKAAEPPYTQAVANIELIAAYAAHLMLMIEDAKGLNVSKIHFVGHSLGAHLGGAVGSWLIAHSHEKLARISGLDPAQPYFQNYPPDVRLDREDAELVDVIHTDAKPLLHGGSITGLGTIEPSGHADFYPNNGKDQPGCKDGVYQSILQEDGSLISGLKRFIGCDHIRAYEYFTESIRSPCSFTSYSCSSWEDFLTSSCNLSCGVNNDRLKYRGCFSLNGTTWVNFTLERSFNLPLRLSPNIFGMANFAGLENLTLKKNVSLKNCNFMGFHSRKPEASEHPIQIWHDGLNNTKPAAGSVLYYSITGPRIPFCREHYQITLKLAGLPSMRTSYNFHIVIFGNKRMVRILRLGERNFRGGLTYKFIIGGPPMDFEFDKAILKPASTNPIWWFVSRMAQTTPDIMFSSVSILNLERSAETILCPDGMPYLNLSDRNPHVLLTSSACSKPTTLPFIPTYPSAADNNVQFLGPSHMSTPVV